MIASRKLPDMAIVGVHLHSTDSVPITFLAVYLHIKVCHAELNAILNKNSADVKGCTIYVALFPCNECAKLIIQSGSYDC
uniref:dCMP deaminase n=1 Tax=Amphimedon queenslandica TaxID=400682 RepID=A0A1X7T9A4_AMPQE